MMNLFPQVVEVVKYVEQDGSTLCNHYQTKDILSYFNTFDYVFFYT